MTILIDCFRPNYDLSAVGMWRMKSRCNWGIGLKPCWRSCKRTEMCVCVFFSPRLCVFSGCWWIQGLAATSVVGMPVVSIGPLDLFAWILCLLSVLSKVSLFGDLEYNRYSCAVVASVSVWSLVLFFYHAASFCSGKKLLFVCYFSHCHSSLFPPPVSTPYQQLCYRTSENPALNVVFSNLDQNHRNRVHPCFDGSQKGRSNVKVHTPTVSYLSIFFCSSPLLCTRKQKHTPPSMSGPGCPCGLFAFGPLTPVKASKLQPFS